MVVAIASFAAPITFFVQARCSAVTRINAPNQINSDCSPLFEARLATLGAVSSRPSREDLYNQIFDINVKGVLFTVQNALPLLPDGAAIILNASIVASKGLAANSIYGRSTPFDEHQT